MSGMFITEYVPEIERVSSNLQERGRALGFGADDVRHRYFIATANALSMYAVSWTLIHAAQQFGRGDFTTLVDGVPQRTNDTICPRVVNALFRERDEAGATLWNAYMGKLKAHLFHDAWGAFEDAVRRTYAAVVSPEHQDEDASADVAELLALIAAFQAHGKSRRKLCPRSSSGIVFSSRGYAGANARTVTKRSSSITAPRSP